MMKLAIFHKKYQASFKVAPSLYASLKTLFVLLSLAHFSIASGQSNELNPKIKLTVLAGDAADGTTLSITRGEFVTYQYILENRGNRAIGDITIVDSPHGDVIAHGDLISGDSDQDGILDIDETWTYELIVTNLYSDLRNLGLAAAKAVEANGDILTGIKSVSSSDFASVKVIPLAEVTGYVLEDIDQDGIGDEGIPEVKITLQDSKSNYRSTLTDEAGYYSFDKVISGSYIITQSQPEGYKSISDSDHQNDNIITGEAIPDQIHSDQTFIEAKEFQSVSGSVMKDTNGDKQGDTPLSAVKISMTDGSGLMMSTMTDISGGYTFEVAVGNYTINQEDKNNYSSISDASDINDNIISGTILQGQKIEQLNFVDTENATIVGKVEMDQDNDGIADIPMGDVSMRIITVEGEFLSTKTNVFGNYAFSIKPGDFMIMQEDAEGYRSVSDVEGANDNRIAGRALPGAIIENQNFLDALSIAPCVSLTKTSTLDFGADGIATPGDQITYVFEVQNCGNEDLDNIVITDLAAQFSGSNPFPAISNINPSILTPGQTGTGTAVYNISQFDIDSGIVSNQASVEAQDPSDTVVEDISDSGNPADEQGTGQDPTTTIINGEACIELIKFSTLELGMDGVATPGDEIKFEYEVINCGNLTLQDVNIIETTGLFSGTNGLPIFNNPVGINLSPGQTGSGSAAYQLSQFDIDAGVVTNQAIVSGMTTNGIEVQDVSDSGNPIDDMGTDADITQNNIIAIPCLELIKSSSLDLGPDGVSTPGDGITYTFEFSNCGNVTIDNISIEEIASAFTGSGPLPIPSGINPIMLLPGQTGSGTAAYSISQFDIDRGSVINQAMITGDAPDGMTISDESDSGNVVDDIGTAQDPTVTILPGMSCISLIKGATINTGQNQFISVGDIIRYDYKVMNCGFDSINNIVISETAGRFSGTGILPSPTSVSPTTIAPGQTGTAESFYAITQEDIDNRVVINQASVSATSMSGANVSDLSDSDDPFDNTGGTDDPTTTALENCQSLACNSGLRLSLSESCELVLNADMLLEDPLDRANYSIELFDQDDNFLRFDTIFATDEGKDLVYKISCGANSCWGNITVENNIIPQLTAPCACGEDGVIPEACRMWCGGAEPSIIVTVEEAMAQFNSCGPELVGDLIVRESRTGNICDPDGEIVEISYRAKIILHGELETVDLLCQSYKIEKLDIDLSADDFDKGFGFPRNVELDCHYISELNDIEGNDFAYGTPASIHAATGSGSLAYSYFIDKHQDIDLIKIDTIITHVVGGTVERDTVVKQDLDQDGTLEWVLLTVVDKILKDSIVYDTIIIGQGHPEVPIIEKTCNLLASYSDLEFDACGSGKKIVRDWIMIDWCDAEIQRNGSQTIYIKDRKAPQVIDENGEAISELGDIIARIDPWTCKAQISLPDLNIIDDCSTDLRVEWQSDHINIEDGAMVDLSIAEDIMEVSARVIDDCNNATEISFNLVVIDDSPPVAVCESSLVVVLSTQEDEGFAKVFAEDLDAGSHDSACGKVTIKAVREDDWIVGLFDCAGEYLGYEPRSCSPLTASIVKEATKDCPRTVYEISEAGDYVKFCCEDVDKEITVLLFLTDESGNTNICRVPVKVENKTIPTLICEDAIVNCDADTELIRPRMIGSMCGSDTLTAELLNDLSDDSSCRGGSIIREWYIDLDKNDSFNEGDAYCRQILTLNKGSLFNPYTIQWPVSLDGSGVEGFSISCQADGTELKTAKVIQQPDPVACMPDDEQFKPKWCETDCNIIGYSQEADTIASPSGCLSVVRKWTVIDWCTYETNGVDQSEDDTIEAVHDHRSEKCITCDAQQSVSDSLYFRYSYVEEDGYYTYDQLVKVVDDTPPEINISDTIIVEINTPRYSKSDPTECMNEAMITASAVDYCGGAIKDASRLQWTIIVTKDFGVIQTLRAMGDSVSVSSQYGEAGDIHEVLWAVRDACGNQSSGITVVYFRDVVAPTPLCISGLATSASATDNEVVVWGADFDFGSFDNCSDSLIFTVVREGESPLNPSDLGFEQQRGIRFGCGEFENYNSLDVWIWDEAGNADHCTVALTLEDNALPCAPSDTIATGELFTIAGSVETSTGLSIHDATVEVTTTLSEYPKVFNTDSDGEYQFDHNPFELNYTVSSSKDGDDLNGVSALDLVFISRHIVDIQPLDDPFKILASDVSRDGRVSALDIIELKRLILGINDEFTDTDSWLFLKKDQIFADPISPWPFIEDVQIINLERDMMSEDFIGIKMGDTNGNADPQNLGTTETRAGSSVDLLYQDRYVNDGDIISLELKLDDMLEIYGFQVPLLHEGLELMNVTSSSLDITSEEYHTDRWLTNIVWYKEEGLTLREDDAILNLTFKAQSSGKLSEILGFQNSRIEAEIYHGADFHNSEIYLLGIEFESAIKLGQNEPNPFSEFTNIPFSISDRGEVTLQIFNGSGKLIYKKVASLNRGEHRFKIRDEDVSGEGILYYKINFKGESQTKKMVMIK